MTVPKRPLFIVIVGCGRLGSYLANRLSRDGHSVVVIDSREAALDNLNDDFSGFRLEGDATEFTVLKEAKTAQADLLIAATREDNLNVMVAQIAQKIFHVPRVMARVFDPRTEEIYRAMGIKTVNPTSLAGHELMKSMSNPQPAGDDA